MALAGSEYEIEVRNWQDCLPCPVGRLGTSCYTRWFYSEGENHWGKIDLSQLEYLPMDDRRIIVLFGDSLLMDTVEASLGDNSELGVMRMHSNVPDIGRRLKSIQPHLIIFDWDAPHSHFVLPFLREQSGVPLLGLDVTCSKAIMLCSQEHTILTADELAELIRAKTANEILEFTRRETLRA